MTPDSLAVLDVHIPPNALPRPVLYILLVGFFVICVLVIQKAKGFKTYTADFPTQAAPVVIGLAGFVAAIPVTLARMALGMHEYDGMGNYMTACCALAGVGGLMLGVKRFSSPEYQQGKAAVEAAKAGAAPAVNVQGDATVNATAERPVPVVKANVTANPTPFGGMSND